MANEATPAPTGAGTDTSIPAAATPPAATPPAPNPEADKEPHWLAARLDRERKAMLKEMGVEDVANAKAAMVELKKRQDSERTELDRLKQENDQLKTTAKRVTELEGALKVKADAELASLSAGQREAVMALAGEDPSKVITAIEKLKTAGMFAATAASPAPQSATTAPPATAPNPAPTPAPVSHLATWERLKTENPMLAASYRLSNLMAIQAEQKARA